jgi:hypothetical protein
MRALTAMIVAGLLLVVLPAAPVAAKPTGTTQIAQAGAFFTSWVAGSETCDSDHLIITLGEDAFRGTSGEDKPPTTGPWLDVQVWHESGCETPVQSGYIQQTLREFDPGWYGIDSLSSAYVDVVFPIYDGEDVIRTLTLDLSWFAQGDAVRVMDRNEVLKMNGWERDAHLGGVVADSWELIGIGDLDYASMLTANYLMQ